MNEYQLKTLSEKIEKLKKKYYSDSISIEELKELKSLQNAYNYAKTLK